MLLPTGEPRGYSELSEEKTEPFSQSEIQARLQRSRMEELKTMSSAVLLDKLVVPPDKDIRILLRPLAGSRAISPGDQDNCRLVALHAEEAGQDEGPHKVLAVTQRDRDIRFTVTIPDVVPGVALQCELYYDPQSDNQIFRNRSILPVTLSRISHELKDKRECQSDVNPNCVEGLAPGTYRINMCGTEALDFRILGKRLMRLRGPSSSSSDLSAMSDGVNAAGKRSFVAGEDDPLGPEKRRRPSDPVPEKEDSLIMFLPAKANPLAFPPPPPAEKGKELSMSSGQPLLDMQADETVEVAAGAKVVEYTITKKEPIASTSLSSVFTAEYSEVPAGVIVVKVLKTRSPLAANNEAAVAKDVIRQADIWLREFQSQENLEHKSIVRLYGGDARFLSLYMEHVDARDLSSKSMWRNTATDLFTGDRSDALHILHDIASALHYIHGKGLVHNDIKPGNILYSRERGAVLCDLGLSTRQSRDTALIGGTPWYVPPEFIGRKQRGPPSDVWALGVTMLYVLGKISWPDARAHRNHPRHLHWLIARVNSRDRDPADRMRQWLTEVAAARNGLDIHDKLERLVHGMLAPNPQSRVTTKEIVNQLLVDVTPDI
ncbi:NUAK family SNF1-like kinase 1 [Madurella mycetomatis]|uniref:NUAK family SNF1-like kinase 1 n=1 Tax=Madurella mycetomatis TaxID=100816 RepID=A0A175WAZ5_9PEZI|nr:NUAK family SNF1-like kinase 1 [Madurella mycetomatis]